MTTEPVVYFGFTKSTALNTVNTLLTQVRQWPEIETAGRTSPDMPEMTISSRNCTARLKDGFTVDDVRAKLEALPGIRFVEGIVPHFPVSEGQPHNC